MNKTMKAVVFDGPGKVSVQDRPVPQLQHDTDVILKVEATALCGSELHVFRGLEPDCGAGFIMGHEFVGSVVAAGPAVASASVAVGDRVVAPFTVSCGACFYCTHNMSSRCTACLLFGSRKLDGGQAEYVRVPRAEATLVKAPADISAQSLVLMADIFPTGFFGARNAFRLLAPDVAARDAVVVVVGCGPVGLCAIVAALDHGPRHVFAIDSVASRLALAAQLGAEPLNFAELPADGTTASLIARIQAVTDGRGADAVIEVVGLSAALRTAFDVVRPFGVISSIGVHHDSAIPWSAGEAYAKNVQVRMGRCPVRSIFAESLAVLARHQHKFDFMFDKRMPLTAAAEGYALFDKMKVQKVVFTPGE